MRRVWLRWLLWSVCRLRQVGHALAAASLRRARGQGAALEARTRTDPNPNNPGPNPDSNPNPNSNPNEAWMRVAAQRAVQARGALHWATRGR